MVWSAPIESQAPWAKLYEDKVKASVGWYWAVKRVVLVGVLILQWDYHCLALVQLWLSPG